MKKYLILLSSCLAFFFLSGCNDDTFLDDPVSGEIDSPKNLVYQEIKNVREFSFLKSSQPTIDADGLAPNFEIVSIRKEDGTILDASFLNDVSIQNPIKSTNPLDPEDYYEVNGETITTFESIDTRNNGVITILDENKFGIDTYYFTIKATTIDNEKVLSTTFEDVFQINVGPELVTNLLYSPLAQNLVVGTEAKTTQPFLITGNPDVTFALLTEDDKLNIDSKTGVISLESSYATVENDTIFPMVEVTSTISGEKTQFQGESFLLLVASNTPVDLPKQTKYFFYPTLEANNKLFGYSLDIIKPGAVPEINTWQQTGSSPLANLDTTLPTIDGKQALITNTFRDRVSIPHESDVIINSQDLSQFSQGFNLATVFYTQNRFVEYSQDDKTPSDLEIYISTDYTGDNQTATWTKVNDQVSCQINSLTATPFIGTPYPGDQIGANPDGLKDPTKNADGKWVRCELDLNPYKLENNFTLKFKFASYFTGTLNFDDGEGRSGRYFISDVYFKATEQ